MKKILGILVLGLLWCNTVFFVNSLAEDHICCGYPNKLDAVDYPKASLESYWKISEALNNSKIDEISLEDPHRNNNLSLLEKFDSKTIILGVVKIASSEIETEEKINQRVQ